MSRSYLNDATNKLDAGDTAGVDIIGDQVTVSAWVKPISSARQTIAGKWEYQSGDKLSYVLEIDGSGHVMFETGTNGGGADIVQGVDNIPLRQNFVHVLGTKRGIGANLLKVFLGGKETGSNTSVAVLDNTPSPFVIGVGHTNIGGDQFPFIGDIAEVAVWNVGRTNAEIFYLAQGGSPANIRPGNLRGYWPLTDYRAGGMSRDKSRFGADAIMTGSVPPGAEFYTTTTSVLYVPAIIGAPVIPPTYLDSDTVYLDLQASGTDIYSPPCFLIGEGEATLRWTTGDDYLRWLGNDANLRFEAEFRVGTAHC